MKTKRTTFSIGVGFPLATRQARRKLVGFAKAQNKPFKVSADRMHINKQTYIDDVNTGAMVLAGDS